MSHKKNSKKSNEQQVPFTTERLCEIWEKILADPEARGALGRLDKAGFPLSHLKPHDATFVRPCWADYLAALPLVPSKASTRQIHYATTSRKYLPLVEEMRHLANKFGPFGEVEIFTTKDYSVSAIRKVREDLLETASKLEDYLTWNYYVRDVNRRHALIAELRWTIRDRTGRPHDRELNILFDAAFRAAGYKEGFCIDSTTLDRIEKRQRENRARAMRRILERMKASAPSQRSSTRIRRDSRKRV